MLIISKIKLWLAKRKVHKRLEQLKSLNKENLYYMDNIKTHGAHTLSK